MDVSAKGPPRQVERRFEHEIDKVEGSRFITTLLPCTEADEVLVVQGRLRAEHPHSRHVCFAHVGSSELSTRFSDDGEPSKTAGYPMLRVLLGASLRNTGALVVRYFGGVKLGTGGLVRAYTDAVRQSVERASLIALRHTEQRVMRLGYAAEPKVRAWCERVGVTFSVVEYGPLDVQVRLEGEPPALDEVLRRSR